MEDRDSGFCSQMKGLLIRVVGVLLKRLQIDRPTKITHSGRFQRVRRDRDLRRQVRLLESYFVTTLA